MASLQKPYSEPVVQAFEQLVSVRSLLVLVLDTNPIWWGSRGENQLKLSQCLDAALVFANSHLMLSHSNKLAIIAAHINRSQFLYPVHKDAMTANVETESGDHERAISCDGKYELFSQVEEIVQRQMQLLVSQYPEGDVSADSVVAGALAMSLCYIHRLEKECTIGEKMSARILVVKGSEDNPSQYMNFMNAVFTAQKQVDSVSVDKYIFGKVKVEILNVVIDACIIGSASGLLQQACDITGGTYLKVLQEMALLQYLLWVFLPDPLIRPKLTLLPRVQVDYRAACFCHRNLIDIGYVCSVCLSIFCSFSPICSTCQTTFKIMGPPKAAKKKLKKSG